MPLQISVLVRSPFFQRGTTCLVPYSLKCVNCTWNHLLDYFVPTRILPLFGEWYRKAVVSSMICEEEGERNAIIR